MDALDRLRQGTLYDHISVPFDQESDGSNYIKLRDRRPAVIWNGAKMLVDQVSGLMWGDEQMPIVRTYDGEEPSEEERSAEAAIQHLVEVLDLDSVMDEVTEAASSGSCAVVVRSTDEKQPYIEVIPGKECKPAFDPRNPMRLIALEHIYPTTGAALFEMGYEIKDEELKDAFWFRIVFDKSDETRYLPMRDDRFQRLGELDQHGIRIEWVVDKENSGPHGWPTVNVLWMKAPKGNRIDGKCLYEPIADILVEIDYDLSQVGRGYRYTADPMLAIRRGELRAGVRPAGYDDEDKTQKDSSGAIVKSPTNVLDIEPGGEAKLLEISGQGLKAASEYIKQLREWGLEICGGMKSDASTTKGVESGRALEMLFQDLILVLKRWRVALGNKGFLPLVRLLLLGIEKGILEIEGVEPVSTDTTMRLLWPAWMTPSGNDLLATAQAWQSLAGGSTMNPVAILPRNVVTRMAGTNLGMNDVAALIDEIDSQAEEDQKAAQEQADLDAQRQAAIKQAPVTKDE